MLNPLTPYVKWIKLAAIAALLGAIAWAAWHAYDTIDARGYARGKAAGDRDVAALKLQLAQQEAKAQADARAKEHAGAVAMAAIESKHQEELLDAQAKADAVIAGLRAGNLRLRQEWRCPAAAGMHTPATRGADTDAAAEQRSKDAADLVRIAAEADAQIRALQRVVQQDRRQ